MRNELILHFADGTSSAGLYVYLLRNGDHYGAVRSIEGYVDAKSISFIALTTDYGNMKSVVRVYPIDKVVWFEEADPLMVKRDIKLSDLIKR